MVKRVSEAKLRIMEWIYANYPDSWLYDYPCASAYMGYYVKHARELERMGLVEIEKAVNPKTNRIKQRLKLTEKGYQHLLKLLGGN